MKAVQTLVLLTLTGLVASSGWAQGYAQDYEDEERPKPKAPIPSAGFWPTPRMMERFIDRITEEMAGVYDFDEDQLYNTRELFKERFPAWLEEHRGEIMQVTNEYIEALLDDEPPDPEYVADWAQRALPLFEGFADVFEVTMEDMRTYLTDEQQVILDGQVAAFRTGMSFLSQRLGVWSEGGFDPATEWPGNPEARRIQRERDREMRQAIEQAEREARGEPVAAGPGGTAEARLAAGAQASGVRGTPAVQDEWTRYVEEFIRRYQLTEAQQASAYKFLRFAQQQRDKYLRRRGDKLAETKQAVEKAKSEAERERARQMLERLQKPLDRMFTQLKEKLETLPTRKQRVAAAQAKMKATGSEEQAASKPQKP